MNGVQRIFKSNSVDGDLAKHYFTVWFHDDGEVIVSIRKYILSEQSKDSFLEQGFCLKRNCFGKNLWFQVMGFKLSTFNELNSFLSEVFKQD